MCKIFLGRWSKAFSDFLKVHWSKRRSESPDSLQSCFRSIQTFSDPRLQSLGSGVFCLVCWPLFLWSINVRPCPTCHWRMRQKSAPRRYDCSRRACLSCSFHSIKAARSECLCTVSLPFHGFLECLCELQEVGQMAPLVQYSWIATDHVFNAARTPAKNHLQEMTKRIVWALIHHWSSSSPL